MIRNPVSPCVLQTPAYFNAMLLQILELANEGATVFSLGVLPMILDTENLWKLHSLLRMTRMVCEIVCPGVLLLGETDRTPAEAAAFGGTADMPELHIVNSTQLMSDIWHTVATKDASLLRHGIDKTADPSAGTGIPELPPQPQHRTLESGLRFPEKTASSQKGLTEII